MTPKGQWYINDQDQSQKFHIPRGVEIDNWINWNTGDEEFRYVILDDDSDMLLSQKDNFIQTDSLKGLSKDDVEKAIKILNGEN